MPNEDFVSRQWLIDEYHRRHQGPPGGALKMIEEAPAADVEPVKHGYWYLRGGRPCCSVCNTKALWKDEGGTGGFSHEYVGAKSKRCPECGARMDKGGKTDDNNTV